MNGGDVDDLSSFERQLNEITKTTIVMDDDAECDDIWRQKSPTERHDVVDPKIVVTTHLPGRQPATVHDGGRISPEGSSSSTLSLNKEPTSVVTLCKPITFKSFQKGSLFASMESAGSGSGSGSGSKTNLVQNWERLKDLSFQSNRPTVLQLKTLWNSDSTDSSDSCSGRMLSAHRSALDGKQRGHLATPGKVNVDPPQSPSSSTFDGAAGGVPGSVVVPANGYHSDQSSAGTLRRHPDSKQKSPTADCSVDAKLPFRDRGTSADRSFQLRPTGPSRRNADSAGKSIPVARWAYSRTVREQIGDGSHHYHDHHHHSHHHHHHQDIGSCSSSSLFFASGGSSLLRAASLSKFDDDDEFFLSPPTATAAAAVVSSSTSHSAKPRLGFPPRSSPFAAAVSLDGGDPGAAAPAAPASPALSPGLSLLNSGAGGAGGGRSAYCFAHGGSHSSAAAPSLGLTPRSPVNGPATSPYATLRLQPSRAKSLNRKEPGLFVSTHSSSSIPISPSSRLAEDIQANEIRRLRQDLQWAKEQVTLLTSRLSTNANVVLAFDQSLSNIAHRLQQLSSGAQQKRTGELAELLATVQFLRSQNLGQASVAKSAAGMPHRGTETGGKTVSLYDEPVPVLIGGVRPPICRQPSTDSVTSLVSSAASTLTSLSQTASLSAAESELTGRKKTVGSWLRSSFGKAFSRKKTNSDQKPRPGSGSIAPHAPVLHANSMPSIPYSGSTGQLSYSERTDIEICHPRHHQHHHQHAAFSVTAPSSSQVSIGTGCHKHPSTNCDYLASSQGSYQKPQSNYKKEEGCLKGRLNPPYSSSSSSSSAIRKRIECFDQSTKTTRPNCLDVLLRDRLLRDGHKITVCVETSNSSARIIGNQSIEKDIVIGSLTVGDKTSWDLLDGLVRRVFQEHLIRLDPATSLGLTGESVYNYRAGEITRWKDSKPPELLPVGYLVGDIKNIRIKLRDNREGSVDLLSFETLIPKSILHRYLKLLLEHRRVILSGSTGTGKTYLAQRMAECLVTRSGTEKTGFDAIAIFRVDSQSSKELRQYLTNMADQCERRSDRLPIVVILDNLHHVTSLSDVFNGFLNTNYQNSPYIIGTMNQATCSSTDLQLHHNFRWVLYANHIEPVRSFLGRYLRRLLVAAEVTSSDGVSAELSGVVEWLPKVWLHVNKFLETHCSCDITIGPRLFLLCPMDVVQAQVWFTDLWNYSIVPYLLEAVREGIQTYGCRAPWEDLADWVINSYPWNKVTSKPVLLRLRPEDVGYETKGTPSGEKTTKSERPTETDIMTLLQEVAKHSDNEDANNDAGDSSQAESCKSRRKGSSDSILMTDDITNADCRTTVI